MSANDYNAQRARTRAADEAHAKMLEWYAQQLSVKRSEVIGAITRLPVARAKQLYTQYMEQL